MEWRSPLTTHGCNFLTAVAGQSMPIISISRLEASATAGFSSRPGTCWDGSTAPPVFQTDAIGVGWCTIGQWSASTRRGGWTGWSACRSGTHRCAPSVAPTWISFTSRAPAPRWPRRRRRASRWPARCPRSTTRARQAFRSLTSPGRLGVHQQRHRTGSQLLGSYLSAADAWTADAASTSSSSTCSSR